MTQGLKKSISFVIKALPETKITGEWLAQHILKYISCLSKVESNVHAVVTDNRSPNINSFNRLLYIYIYICYRSSVKFSYCVKYLGIIYINVSF